ncbi:hypothetical protein GIB67_027347 [Kingdonia uniflora]|uniref:Uncharacterized protein n=1 Tax=Kingdonia uniflora TaxID=39325 RepID=A0A7J7MFB5_9MAGN|nr:hypothetical protein GIB67_027347 [Kingdonia uniflora]
MSHRGQPPPSYHRPCNLHPNRSQSQTNSTAFCASCLRERLSNVASLHPPLPLPQQQTLITLNTITNTNPKTLISASASASTLPLYEQLRRTKSFSCSKRDGFASFVEPQRKSCDVRVRNTLWELFGKEGIEGFRDLRGEEEIRVSNVNVIGDRIEEIGEEIDDDQGEGVEGGKTVKDLIDLDLGTKMSNSNGDFRGKSGSFWAAASVFSKKLQKWRSKQQVKKQNGVVGGRVGIMQVERLYSEVGDYGFGRRSCDIDPRVSFDNPRYSLDEPRASCDGYLNFRQLPRVPPMVSVVEDVPTLPVIRTGIPVDDENAPGGSAQTRDYYSDSSQRRRRSFDHSNSKRNRLSEYDDIKSMIPNAKVSPVSNYHFQKTTLLVSDINSRNSNSDSVKEDCSLGIVDKDDKKFRRWKNIWGLINRGNVNKHEEKYRGHNGEAKGAINGVLRRNSSVGSQNSLNVADVIGGGSAEANGHAKKSREEVLIERNQSARYSPNHLDNNGLLRFYLTPLRRSRTTKSRSNSSHSFARSILRLY